MKCKVPNTSQLGTLQVKDENLSYEFIIIVYNAKNFQQIHTFLSA